MISCSCSWEVPALSLTVRSSSKDLIKNLKINWDITKDAHSKTKKDHKKKKDDNPPHAAVVAAKTALDKALT